MEKGEQASAGPAGLAFGSARLGAAEVRRAARRFFTEVRSELKKVTWPSKQEVYTTTIVVIVTTVFFGFYLYGLDLLLTQLFTQVLGAR